MMCLNFKSCAAVLALSTMFFAACNDDDQPQIPLDAITTSILVNATNEGNFTFFSFDKGATVPVTDSASNRWDFGLRFTTFLFNSGSSGPGTAGVQVITGAFNDIREAPESGYKTDAPGNLAVKDDDWFIYNSATRTFSPKAGQVFLIKTAQNKYAKMEILQADPTDNNGNLVTPPNRPTKIKYTFRYVYQPSGARSFSK